MSKPSLKIFITSFVLALFLHLAALSLYAQEAYKIDEIMNPRCELSEVLQIDPPPWGKFATALLNNSEFRGAIVVYGLEGYAARYAKDVRERFGNFVGVAAKRLVTIYGGLAEDVRMELWVVPKGAAELKSNFVEDTKSARKFDTYTYWGDVCSSGRYPALAEFAEALKRRPEWQGYIVIRPHRNKPGVSVGDADWDLDGYVSRRQALRRTTKDKSYLVRKFGLSPARLKAVVGDNDDWTHAELWLVPPGAELPTSKAQMLMRRR
jgi:hypothetical protein